MHVDSLRTMGRATQGVRLISLRGSDEIAAVAKVERDDEDEDVLDADNITSPDLDGSRTGAGEEE